MNKSDQERIIREHAQIAHENNRKDILERQRHAIESAHVAIRAMLLINGGASVALLAFVGAVLSSKNSMDIDVTQLVAPIQQFALGVGLAGVTAALAYLVNLLDSDIVGSVKYAWEHPYLLELGRAKWLRAIRAALHWLALGTAIATLVFFFRGVFSVSAAILSMSG